MLFVTFVHGLYYWQCVWKLSVWNTPCSFRRNSDNCNAPVQATTTTTVLWPFVRDYLGELVPEETLTTHHPDHHPIFISFFHLPRSIASSLFKLRARQSFCTAEWQKTGHWLKKSTISQKDAILSQGRVATWSTCDEIFIDYFITNWLLSVVVKELRESVSISWIYRHLFWFTLARVFCIIL